MGEDRRSVNSDDPSPSLLAYAATKGAIANFAAGLAQLLGKKGIRVISVAPGPIWTPLIPATMPDGASGPACGGRTNLRATGLR